MLLSEDIVIHASSHLDMQSMLFPGTPVFSRLADSGCRDSDLGTGYSWTAAFASRHVANVRFQWLNNLSQLSTFPKVAQEKAAEVMVGPGVAFEGSPKSLKDPSNKLQDLSICVFFLKSWHDFLHGFFVAKSCMIVWSLSHAPSGNHSCWWKALAFGLYTHLASQSFAK